jgi:hypothetical protein
MAEKASMTPVKAAAVRDEDRDHRASPLRAGPEMTRRGARSSMVTPATENETQSTSYS